jgi:hypothetical protein
VGPVCEQIEFRTALSEGKQAPVSLEQIVDESSANFKDKILTNLWFTCKQSASDFDNEHREDTNDIAEELGAAYSRLSIAFKAYENSEEYKHFWYAAWPTWQSINALLGAYQSVRMGFPHEALVVLRYVLENHALAAALILHPEILEKYLMGEISGNQRIADLKALYSEMGRQYGTLTDAIAHPKGTTTANFLHEVEPEKFSRLIGGGLPQGSSGFVRGDTAMMAVGLCGLNSSYLDATSELIGLKFVKQPMYWKREDSGVVWHPTGKVGVRFARRREAYLRFYMERIAKYAKGDEHVAE